MNGHKRKTQMVCHAIIRKRHTTTTRGMQKIAEVTRNHTNTSHIIRQALSKSGMAQLVQQEDLLHMGRD
jgi:hypothetical protein